MLPASAKVVRLSGSSLLAGPLAAAVYRPRLQGCNTRRAALQLNHHVSACRLSGVVAGHARFAPTGMQLARRSGEHGSYPSPSEPPIANGAVGCHRWPHHLGGARDHFGVLHGRTVPSRRRAHRDRRLSGTRTCISQRPSGGEPSPLPHRELSAALGAHSDPLGGVVRLSTTGLSAGNPLALRLRIEAGEVAVHRSCRSGWLRPCQRHPYYLLPSRLPELTSPVRRASVGNRLLTLRHRRGQPHIHRLLRSLGIPSSVRPV